MLDGLPRPRQVEHAALSSLARRLRIAFCLLSRSASIAWCVSIMALKATASRSPYSMCAFNAVSSQYALQSLSTLTFLFGSAVLVEDSNLMTSLGRGSISIGTASCSGQYGSFCGIASEAVSLSPGPVVRVGMMDTTRVQPGGGDEMINGTDIGAVTWFPFHETWAACTKTSARGAGATVQCDG